MIDKSKDDLQVNIDGSSKTKEEKKNNKSIKKNYFYNLAYQIFMIIVPLIVTPYVSRVLTPEGVGHRCEA